MSDLKFEPVERSCVLGNSTGFTRTAALEQGRAKMWLRKESLWRCTTPHYVFFCRHCNKKFEQRLHISELGKTSVKCPIAVAKKSSSRLQHSPLQPQKRADSGDHDRRLCR